jgi:hypothetical protein
LRRRRRWLCYFRDPRGDGSSGSGPPSWPPSACWRDSHWLSDVVAGAALGIAGVHVIRWIFEKLMPARDVPRDTEVAAETT